MNKELSHVDQNGKVQMVDVSEKKTTKRTARAVGEIKMQPETLKKIKAGNIKKGAVIETARIAGITGAKKTSDLIPMCHPLLLSSIKVDFDLNFENKIKIFSEVKNSGQTGVEMEALTAVNLAALTIYDMIKAVDKSMEIGSIKLMYKAGGKSGIYEREEK
ncbi:MULTISPECIES: cyclic pyranopterin monophosphate synthase MoaC [Halanaerobium]|jgi:cyclic pyranopterin phosphate synthase|uniref:Cyclic pyranopterin monophosphate synthase n=1 Tax=Halanaerobium congolense TaxID=54121 RepID=A0A1G6R1R6_9FIRM|nr:MULTISPECIES: cyclic pyranopterin monophosphate synthase MoaC [Halanaerobium]PUU90120.1 MAG: molybdenum cofactor biosynthesis protein C [Halanaerobium sp.]PUU91497.1 MAG: molybdenum cofactor biosynthesis protein C [Halanaerobium sp.]TDS32865.1 cyclic pyranopterin monophosphate synthase subunit MoaC [Halanaerobium congolense]TDX41858.1 cyclic pyranopterin monophosphate synthase subunit MoaC [Halanaerobium congolense]SDC98610.1 cyclic pyranopterin monophosphate synthase subunit MoaC [Halanaer